jgi:hydantoinase/carbamoylase family amidase
MNYGARILEQADILSAMTEVAGQVTRTYLTPMARRAGDQIIAWMKEAGCDEAAWDALGNVVGRYHGTYGATSKVLMTGSHMDSVVNAGKYDGLLGILSPIACVHALTTQKKRLPFTFEIVAFGDEEGVRFGVTLIGSKAMAGKFEPTWWDKTDKAGITLRQAVTDFGGDPQALETLARDRKHYLGFIESHIEQGPILLNESLAVGVVTSIAGATRVRVNVRGLAGHAGTVPMVGRQDALTAAAEMALAVEQLCAAGVAQAGDIVGTVGKFDVAGGGAMNVIPGEVNFTIDIRSGDDATRLQAVSRVEARCKAIATRRKVAMQWDAFFHLSASPCDEGHQAKWARSIASVGLPVKHLPSGAGHDAMSFNGVMPLSMLFVRCGNGGVSHNPLETMTEADADITTRVMLHFLEHFQT